MERLIVSILLISWFSVGSIHGNNSEKIYRFSFFIQGSFKGKVFIVIPFRIFYQASSSVDFTAEPKNSITEFKSLDIGENGHMVRTLGFLGKNLAILTAGRNENSLKEYSKRLLKNFKYIAPGYAKNIRQTYFNYFSVKRISPRSLSFTRSDNGIHFNISNHIKLTRVIDSAPPLKINFNIYRILAVVLKVFNHSFLPKGVKLNNIDKLNRLKWKSPELNFTGILKNSSLHAAKIFKKIKDIGQKNSFRAVYGISSSDKKSIEITGISNPKISIWNNLLIESFRRDISLNKKDLTLISDKIKVTVSDGNGNGGYFISYLNLRNRFKDN